MIANTAANALSEKEIPFSDFLPDWPDLMRGDDDGDDP
jgi:hypothetical protein